MKKQNLNEERPKRMTWSKFRDMKLSDIKQIIAEHGKVIIISIEGDVFELTEVEF